MSKREELIREADAQTRAIMRLEVYKRLGYTAVTLGALAVYANVWQDAATWVLVAGIVAMVIGAVVSFVLYVGIARAKENVKAILRVAGVDPDDVRTHRAERE